MKADTAGIHDIFRMNTILEIPFFQRKYVWQAEDWQRLLDDVLNIVETEQTEYFMGALIIKAIPRALHQPEKWELIDGQQRLTTLALLLKAIAMSMDNDDLYERKIKPVLFHPDEKLRIEHNIHDKEIFKEIMTSQEAPQKNEKNSLVSAFLYFRDEEKINQNPHLLIEAITSALRFVAIRLEANDDEQQIFDAINSLGVTLTTAELLKNHLFSRENINLYKKNWEEVFEAEEGEDNFWDKSITSGREAKANIDLFLQSVLLIISNGEEKYRGGELFKNYKKFIKNKNSSKEKIINSIKEYAGLYREHINPDILDQEVKSHLDKINLIIFSTQTTAIIPYLLYILKTVESDEEREKMFALLGTYLIRRIICKATSKDFNNLFARLIRQKINTYTKLETDLLDDQTGKTNYFPHDAELENSIKDVTLSNQNAKIVLYLMEISIKQRSGAHTTRLYHFNHYHLEHVMPKKWRVNWRSNLTKQEGKERDEILKKLGNLTIISGKLNQAIQHSSWRNKKTGSGRGKGLEAYARGISTFDEFLSERIWDESVIEKRANLLKEEIKKIWCQPRLSKIETIFEETETSTIKP